MATTLPIITASNPTPTSTGVDGGMDVAVDVVIDGERYCGGVTLIQGHDGGWDSWGSRDNWMDQPLLNAVDVAAEPSELMGEIAAEAASAIESAA
jgi:hypothetical protein